MEISEDNIGETRQVTLETPVESLEITVKNTAIISSTPGCVECGSKDYFNAIFDAETGKGPYCGNSCRAADNEGN